MREEQDYIRDISEMRSLMERSSKFLSLSGLAGVMAGIYALSGACIAYRFFNFNPDGNFYSVQGKSFSSDLLSTILLAILILVLTLSTAILLSYQKAIKRGEKFWNSTAKRLLINMAVPLISGGVLILILITKGLVSLMAPFTLLFYGLALYNASKFTFEETRSLGLIQIGLGLISSHFTGYGLIFWAAGFGVVHIIYGIYLHYKYER